MDARLLKKLRKQYYIVERNGQFKAIYPDNESKWVTKVEAISYVLGELNRYLKICTRKPKKKIYLTRFN